MKASLSVLISQINSGMEKVSCHSKGGTQEFVMGVIHKLLKLEKRFLKMVQIQCYAIKSDYEEGNQKLPFSYQISFSLT